MFFAFCSLGFLPKASADLTLTPRLEYVRGEKGDMDERFLFKTQAQYPLGDYVTFYFDGFGEFENDREARIVRRSPSRGYLQELYLELKNGAFYLKAGRQALRWSEMWILPSLDVWTGRRYNRLFLDPLSEQMTHPTGILASYALEAVSFDAVWVYQSGEFIFPQPMEEKINLPPREFYGGGRVKVDIANFGLSALAAKSEYQEIFGGSVNYSFEKVVPKIEAGHFKQKTSYRLSSSEEDEFVGLGADIFLDSLTIQPQVTYFDFQYPGDTGTDFQSIFYLSGTFQKKKHNIQVQTFFNSATYDFFASFRYAFNLTKHWTIAGYIQHYSTDTLGVMNIYSNLTGGTVGGLLVESSWGF